MYTKTNYRTTQAAAGSRPKGLSASRCILLLWSILSLFLILSPAAAATYTWTGGGAADTRWTTPENWGETTDYPGMNGNVGADVAIFSNTNTVVTLDQSINLTNLSIDYPPVVQINLNGYTLDIDDRIDFGISSGTGNGANAVISGPGNLIADTVDCDETNTNTISLVNGVTLTCETTLWGNQNPGTTSTFTGDGTATFIMNGTVSGATTAIIFENIDMIVDGITYTISVTGTQAPGQTVSVLIAGGFNTGKQFRYFADYINAGGTAEQYTLESDGPWSQSITADSGSLAAPVNLGNPNTIADEFTFTITYPATIDNDDGLNVTVVHPDLGVSLGSIYFQNTNTGREWVGGDGAGAQQTDWSRPANWSPASVPDASSIVSIPNTGFIPTLTATSVASTITVESGATLNLAGQEITAEKITNNGRLRLTGGETLNVAALISGSASTVEYYGTGSYIPIWGNSYRNLELSAGTLTTSGALSLTGDLSVTGGTFELGAGISCNDLTVAAGGAIDHTASNTITASGDVSILGGWTTPVNSTLVMTGSSSLDAVPQLGALTIDNNNTVSLSGNELLLAGALLIGSGSTLSDAANDLGMSVSGATTVMGTGLLTLGDGTYSFAAIGGTGSFTAATATGSTSISGNLTVSTFTHNSGTVTFTGGTHNSYLFNNVTINGTVSSNGAWTLAGNLLISGGEWTAGAFNHQIAGNWTNNVGPAGFVNTGSTIRFTGGGPHQIGGSADTNFNNLTNTAAGSTMSFTAGRTIGIAGTLTVTGTAGNLITIQSSSAGSTWSLSNAGAQSVSFVRVADSPATTASINATNSIDLSGNNTNWVFGAISWLTGTGSTDANLGTNWATGVTPGQYDRATVPGGGTQPVQTATLSLRGLTLAAATSSWSNGGQSLTLGTGSLSNNGTFTYTGAGTLTGMPAIIGGTFVYSGGTVGMIASVTTYNNLTISGGTITAIAATVIGTTSVTGGTFELPAITFNTGILTVGAGGNITNTGINIINASGAVTVSGTFSSPAYNTLAMTGSGVNLTATPAIGNLTVNPGPGNSVNLASSVQLAGNLLLQTGTLAATTHTLSVAGNISDNTNTGALTFTAASAGTLTLNGNANVQNVDLSQATINNLVINNTNGTPTVTADSAIVVGGSLTRTAGNLMMSGNQLSVAGNITHTAGTLSSSGTITLNGSALQTINLDGANITHLELDNANGANLTNTAVFTWGGNAILTAGALQLANVNGQVIGGNVTGTAATSHLDASAITAGNTLTVSGTVGTNTTTALQTLSAPAGTLEVAGSTWNVTTLTVTATPGTVEFTGTGAQTLIPNGQTFGPVVASGTGGVSMTGTATFTRLDIGDGAAFTIGGSAITTLTLSGSGADVLRTGTASDGFRWNATGAAASLNFSGAAPIINNRNAAGLRVTAGSAGNVASLSGASAANRVSILGNALDLNGQALSLSNSSTAIAHSLTDAGSTLNLAGSNTFSGGLTVNNGTAVINTGSSTLSASTLTAIAGTITIDAGNVSVSGALTLNGGTMEIAATPTSFSAGSFNHASGTWNNTTTNTLSVGGNVVVAGSFNDATNSRIIMNGPTPNINTAVQIGHLEITTSAAVSAITNQLRLAGNLSLATGTSLNLGALGAAITGNASGSGTASLDGGTAAVSIGGDFTIPNYTASSNTTSISGTTVSFGTLTHSGGTISLNGTTGPVSLTTGDQLLNNLSLSSTAAKTVNVTGELTTNASLTVGANCTLAVGNNELNVGTTTTNSGIITLGNQSATFTGLVTNTGGSITGDTGTLTFIGGISGGTLTASENDTYCGGSFSPASFTHNSGDLTLNGTATPVALAGVTYNNLFLAKTAAATINASGTITVEGTLDVNANNTLSMAANPLSVTGTTDNAGSISSSGAGTQSYTALVTNTGDITGAGLITLSGGITGAGTTTAGSGGVTAAATATFTSGTLDINGSSWTQSAGDLVLETLSNPAGSSISFTGSAAQGFSTNNQALGSVSMNMNAPATTLTITGNLNQSANTGVLTLTQGTLVMGGNTLTLGANLTVPAASTLSFADGSLVGGARNISVTGGSLTLGGSSSLTTTGSFSLSGAATVSVDTGDFATGAMSLTGTTSFTQTGDNGAASFSQAVASLDVASGTTCTWDAGLDGGSLDITGNVIANGTLNFNNKNVRIGGTITGNITFLDLVIPNGGIVAPQPSSSIRVLRHLTIEDGGRYVHNDRPITLGGGSITVGTFTDQNTGANPLQNLGAVTLVAGGGTTTKTLGSALLMSDLEIEANVNLAAGGYGLAIDGDAVGSTGTITGDGSLTATGNQTIAVGGDFTIASFTAGSSTVRFNDGPSTIDHPGSFYNFYGLTMDLSTSTNTLILNEGITVTNALTLTRGDFRAGSHTHYIANNWDSSAATVTWNATSSGTSTIHMTSTSPNITTKAADSFNNLTLDVGGALSPLVAAGTTSIRNDFNAAALGTGGTLVITGSSTLAVAGDVNLAPTALAGATLIANSSTLSLNGTASQTITTNNQSWYNLAIGTRVAGNTVSFTGELNVTNGAAGQGLTTAAGAYNIAINDGGTVANAVTFANTGTLILNTDAGEIFTATGGLTATAPSSVSVAGTIETTGTDMALGLQTATPHTVILAQNTSLSTGALAAGTITLGPVNGGATARTLSIEAGTGNLVANGQLGATNTLASLTLSSAGNASFARGISSIGTISLNNSGVLTLADPEGDADTATVNISTTSGNFQQTGASRVDVAADFSIAGTTSFARPIELVGNVASALTGDANFGASSTIDSASGTAYSLAFTGNGDRSFNAAIGSTTPIGDLTLSGTGAKTFIASVELDNASGDLTVEGSTNPVHFQDTFAARSASQSDDANPISFDGNVFLASGPSNFLGNVTLDSLDFLSTGNVQFGSNPIDSDTLTLSGATVTLGGNGQYTVYSEVAGNVALTLSGGTQASATGSKIFYGNIGTPAALLSITQEEDSGPATFAANVTTGDLTTLANVNFGPMTLNASGSVQIGSNPIDSDTATLIGLSNLSGDAVYSVHAPLSGNNNLVLIGAGDKTFYNTVGGSAAATAIGSGTGPAISQIGTGQIRFESTVLTASGISQNNLAGPIIFHEDIYSAAGDTDTELNADITLDGLSWTSDGDITIGNDATNTLTLSSDSVTITTTAASRNITINSQLTGAQDFSLSTGTATARLAGPVGYEPLNLPIDLSVTAGAIELAGASIVTDGRQVFTGPVGLFANTTLSSNGAGAAGTISFSSSLDSDALATARSLAVNTAGPLTFNGAVGATNPLASITSDAAGTASITGGSVTTTGAQVWNDPVTIGANVSFESDATSGTAILFASTLMPDANNSRGLVVDGGSAQVRFADEAGSASSRFASVDVTTASTAADAILVEGSVLAVGDIDWGAALTVDTSDAADTLLSGSGQQSFAGAVNHTNGIIEAGTGGLDFNASYTGDDSGGGSPTLTGYDSGTASINIAGNMSLAAFTHFEDELVFDGAVTQNFRSNDQVIANLSTTNKTAGNGLIIANFDIYQTGAARTTTIESGWLDIATNNRGWIADTNATATPVPDSFRGIEGNLILLPGTELRCGNLYVDTGYTVEHTGTASPADMSTLLADGSVVFDGTLDGNEYSTLRMTGSLATLDASTELGHLAIAGSIILDSTIELSHNLDIESGYLDASTSNYNITLSGHWTNDVGNAGFVAREGEVHFIRTVADGDIEIRGNTSWYLFVCTVAGQTIQFQQLRTQTFLPGGAFRVQGIELNPIRITRLNADQSSDLDWVPPAEPNPALMWQIDLRFGASLDLTDVEVAYSDARANALSVDTESGVELYLAENFDNSGDEIALTCFRWLQGLQAVYSYTEDEDNNGRIDRIRVQAAGPLNMDFSDFDVNVVSYEIDRSKGTDGFEAVNTFTYPSEFWIHLIEKPWLDTGAMLEWQIIRNTTLKDNATGKENLVNFPIIGISQQTSDTARPLIAYTFALPGHNERLVVFSEPVFLSPGVLPTAENLDADTLTDVTRSGLRSTMTEYLTSLGAALDRVILLNGDTFTTATLIDGATEPHDYSIDPGYETENLPAPRYRDAGRTLPNNDIVSTTHVHSDILISREPAAATDEGYFAWPLWAKDSVRLDIGTDEVLDYDGLEASRQTIGLVRTFNGSQWLRDQDINLQARTGITGELPLIIFDTNVSDSLRSSSENGSAGLWLPLYDDTIYSSVSPEPNTATATLTGTAGPNDSINYSIAASHPKITSPSTLEFFFCYENAFSDGQDRYGARLDAAAGSIPADWYRRIKPFAFDIHDVTLQRGQVSILNNVINPLEGETVRLSYQIHKSGPVTIQVFTLDGSLVEVLFRGNRDAGDYTAIWNGTNRGGRPVARGMYFIRIVAPEIDEIRKVMVVK